MTERGNFKKVVCWGFFNVLGVIHKTRSLKTFANEIQKTDSKYLGLQTIWSLLQYSATFVQKWLKLCEVSVTVFH